MAGNEEIKAKGVNGSSSATPKTLFPQQHQDHQNDPVCRELEELQIRCQQAEDELARTKEALQKSQQQARGQLLEMSSLRAKVTHLQNIIEKQKMTIAHQSRVIAHRAQHVVANGNNDGSRNGHGGAHWNRQSTPMTQMHQQNPPHPFAVNHSAGPFASPQSSVSGQGEMGYPSAGLFMSPPPQPLVSQNGYEAAGNAAMDDFDRHVAYFGGQLHSLWAMADAFGRNFTAIVDEPNVVTIDHVVSFLPHRMMSAALSNDPATRCLLVVKTINFYIVQGIVKFYNVVRGVDPAVDRELQSLKEELSTAKNAAPIVKQALLAAITRQIDTVKDRADFGQICQALQNDHLERLWSVVGPVMRPSLVIAAHDSLKQIVTDAHTMALNLHSAPYEIRFYFPEPHEDFDPSTMILTDPAESSASMNVQKVRLGVTPVTWMGDYSQQRPRVQMISKSRVIVGSGMSQMDGPASRAQTTRDRQMNQGDSQEIAEQRG